MTRKPIIYTRQAAAKVLGVSLRQMTRYMNQLGIVQTLVGTKNRRFLSGAHLDTIRELRRHA